ncbi:MAG: hypothetical protein FK731_06995 [Asgard group archaeon]|nr:hypothetical protein [Asgard group archaeon]
MDYDSQVLTTSRTGIKPGTRRKMFLKSKRFYRGKIVKILIKHQKQTKEQLIFNCKINEKDIDEILKSLVKDGLIENIKDYYKLPEK